MSKYIKLEDAMKLLIIMFGDQPSSNPLSRGKIMTIVKENMRFLPSIDIVYCKYCKWRGKPGCALQIDDESDKPGDYDFCSFGDKEVLLDPHHNCAGCKYEEWWSSKCEKCSRHLVDEYVRKEEAGDD